jgi:hypothetical protein
LCAIASFGRPHSKIVTNVRSAVNWQSMPYT